MKEFSGNNVIVSWYKDETCWNCEPINKGRNVFTRLRELLARGMNK